jgi:cellulose synthase/poly-beta-1,6-N-acetylglucosamine synthase-like glycosyltransferase
MPFLIVPLAALAAILAFVHLALDAGVVSNIVRDRRRAARRTPSRGAPPTATVVVAVRDEEAALPALLSSLERQTAADCAFLLVDDRSTDGTPALLEGFRSRMGGRATVLRTEDVPAGMTGKQAALDLAARSCRTDVMLFTDGDCTVPETWVELVRERFWDPRLGVLFGRLRLEDRGGFLSRFQAFEQPLIHQYNLGGAGMGMPMGCFGNNMAARTEAVREIGGFRGLGYTVTEDAALLSAIGRSGRWKAAATVLAETTISTRGKERWAEYVNQHTRWNAGGFFSSDLSTRLGYRYVTLCLIGSLLLLPFAVLDGRLLLPGLSPFLGIASLGFLGGLYGGVRRGRHYLLLLPYTAFFTLFYSFVTLRAIVRRPFRWKGSLLNGAQRTGGEP